MVGGRCYGHIPKNMVGRKVVPVSNKVVPTAHNKVDYYTRPNSKSLFKKMGCVNSNV